MQVVAPRERECALAGKVLVRRLGVRYVGERVHRIQREAPDEPLAHVGTRSVGAREVRDASERRLVRLAVRPRARALRPVERRGDEERLSAEFRDKETGTLREVEDLLDGLRQLERHRRVVVRNGDFPHLWQFFVLEVAEHDVRRLSAIDLHVADYRVANTTELESPAPSRAARQHAAADRHAYPLSAPVAEGEVVPRLIRLRGETELQVGVLHRHGRNHGVRRRRERQRPLVRVHALVLVGEEPYGALRTPRDVRRGRVVAEHAEVPEVQRERARLVGEAFDGEAEELRAVGGERLFLCV